MIIYIRGAYAVARIKITTQLPAVPLRAGRVRSLWQHCPCADSWTSQLSAACAVQGLPRAVLHPELFVHLPLVLDAGDKNSWTAGFLPPSRAVGHLLPRSLPAAVGPSPQHWAKLRGPVGMVRCAPLGCSSPLYFNSVWSSSMSSSDCSFSWEVMPFLLAVLMPNRLLQNPQVQ